MTDGEIKDVFLANGFSIKPGCDDLQPYVYAAARALLERADMLKALLAHCKCGVYLMVNEHRDNYYTAEERLKELDERECPPEISAEVRAGILSSGNIVELQFYPKTPVGFYLIVHHDVGEVLRLALECEG